MSHNAATVLTVQQGTVEWLEERQRRVGASEIGALACVSPFAGPADVWAAKIGRPAARKADLHRRIGHVLERLSGQMWQEHGGIGATAGPVIADGLLLASLDYWSDRFEPVECKCVTGANPERDLWTESTIPEGIALQITQQAHLVEQLTGSRLEAAHVAAILVGHFGFEFRAYRVPLTAERRELYTELAYDQLPRWWDHYVVGRRPPPDATYQQVAAVVQLDTITRRDATDEEAALLEMLRPLEAAATTANRAAKEAEQARDAVRSRLVTSLGTSHIIPGVTWRRHGKNTLLKLE